MAEKHPLPSLSKTIGRVAPWVVGLLLLSWLVNRSLVKIPDGSVGVRVGQSSASEPLPPGWHLRSPFANDNQIVPIRVILASTRVGGLLQNLQTVEFAMTWQCRAKIDEVGEILADFSRLDSAVKDWLTPLMGEAAEQVVTQYSAEELIASRATLGNEIANRFHQLASRDGNATGHGFDLSPIVITDLSFSKAQRELLDSHLLSEAIPLPPQEAQAQLRALAIEKWDGRLPLVMLLDQAISESLFGEPVDSERKFEGEHDSSLKVQ